MNRLIFVCKNSFKGNILGKEGENPDNDYRFKVVMNRNDKLVVIPEVFIDKNKNWEKASPGWELQDVKGSKGLFLDFGQKKYIQPTKVVWDEIDNKLKHL